MEENAHEQRGKQNKAGNNINIKIFPIKIKILLAYLEKILYLWRWGGRGAIEKTRSRKETSTGHQHCGIPQKTEHFVG